LAAAAALIVAGLVTAGLMARNGGHDKPQESADKPTASAKEDSGAAAGAVTSTSSTAKAAPQTRVEPEAQPTAPATTGKTSVLSTPDGTLGNFQNPDALAAAVASVTRTTSTKAPGTSPSGDMAVDGGSGSCAALQKNGEPARGESTFVGEATYQGNPVVVHVYRTPSGNRLVATRTDTCETVINDPYTG
jgi:hypothetical protein